MRSFYAFLSLLFVALHPVFTQTECNGNLIKITLPLPQSAFDGDVENDPPPPDIILVTGAALNYHLQQEGCVPDGNTTIELLIPARTGQYKAARFEGLNDYYYPDEVNHNPQIVIKVEEGAGEITFSGYSINNDNDPDDSTIEILNCHNLELDGHGIKVLDAYGNGIPGGPNQQGVNIGQASSYIDIHDLDVRNLNGFAGIMAKDSPECIGGVSVDTASATAPYMHHILIHDNYIHDVPQGEGIYAGDTAFMTGRPRGSCGRLHPPKIEYVEIYDNFIQDTGYDAIQLGSCIVGGKIHDNFCIQYGTLGESGQANGIQIGLGNIGTVCERNFLRQSSERSDNAGHGILCQGAGNNCIKNNIIYNTLENAIYVREQMGYTQGDPPAHQYITDEIRATLSGVNIVHNTLMYPAKGVNSNIYGIRVTHNSAGDPPPGCVVENNLIFGTITAIDISPSVAEPKCNENNRVVSEGWKQVRDQYLRSYGTYNGFEGELNSTALQTYLTTAAINEEDNYFRSPVDFYPVHPDIIDQAAYECANACAASADFLGTSRPVSEGCAIDQGAVELNYPVFTITEDCEANTFTIVHIDPDENFSWTFTQQPVPGTPRTFYYPLEGAGSYEISFTNDDSANNCIKASGTVSIELTCSFACEGDDAININIYEEEGKSFQAIPELTQHISDQNFLDLNGRCLNIGGKLLINDNNGALFDLAIENGFMRMQPGAEIVVQDGGGLWINHVNDENDEYGHGIHGCGYMWEGIDVEEGGRIRVENSTIQDAVTAVGVTGNAYVSIQKNAFENNYRGIDIEPLIDLTTNDPTPFSLTMPPGGLSHNYFGTLADGLKGTIDGGIPGGVDSKGVVGIKTAYLDFVLIKGDLTSGSGSFQNLQHGIYARESFLRTTGATFKEVDYGARLFHTSAVFSLNKFNKVALRGIESLNTDRLHAAGNIMIGVDGRGINCEDTPPEALFFLFENTIAAKDHCINVEASNSLNISQNQLTLRQPDEYTHPERSAIRVFSLGQNALTPFARIKDNAYIRVNEYGRGITLENVNKIELNNNIIQSSSGTPAFANTAYRGISLENAAENTLYGNNVQGMGNIFDSRGFHLANSANNKLCCNSTDGGLIGLYFFGPSSSQDGLNNTTVGSHFIGLLGQQEATIGTQIHGGNTWLGADSYGYKAALHLGSREEIEASTFQVEGTPGSSSYWPGEGLISTPNTDVDWFRPQEGNAISCEDPSYKRCDDDLVDSKDSDEAVATNDYVTGIYAEVHNWEVGLDLFDRLEKNDTLRNSEIYYQNFYTQANASALGDYTRFRTQFKTTLGLTEQESQSSELLWTSIQEKLETLTEIGKAYDEATTEADSTALEADWLTQYEKVSEAFADWRQLSTAVRQRILADIPALQLANAALPEIILPAANEKLMNTIQLKRILGEALTQKEYAEVVALAFSCPLEAGNAVYRARTFLRMQADYSFDDLALCGLEDIKDVKPETKLKGFSQEITYTKPLEDWRIYPNPTRDELWLEGPEEAVLSQIALYDRVGSLVWQERANSTRKFRLTLPVNLPAGMYFIALQNTDGSRQTKKLIIKP